MYDCVAIHVRRGDKSRETGSAGVVEWPQFVEAANEFEYKHWIVASDSVELLDEIENKNERQVRFKI